MPSLTFSEVEIQNLFGHEAAEDEDPKRLREYYFKSTTYSQAVADLSLRILVGHKGIGKSALFQIAMAEDVENHNLPILIKPDDILELGTDQSDFLKTIRQWKDGLTSIIGSKVLENFGLSTEGIGSKIKQFGGRLLEFVANTLKNESSRIHLGATKKLVLDKFLKTNRIVIYIDDLDRGWQGRREDVSRISALLNAVRDIANDNKGTRFRIGLRSDVYYLVRTSDESTDKIEGSVVWHTWTNHELFVLLVKRIETFFGRTITDEQNLLKRKQSELGAFLDLVMEQRFQGQGHWKNIPMYRVIMSLIRNRPRDLVKLCTLAAKQANAGKSFVIRTHDFMDIFDEYSQGRVQDTINEFRSELPEIDRLIINMKPSKLERSGKEGYVYTTQSLLRKIDNICERGTFRFKNGKEAKAKELAAFLYKINFLTARRERGNGIVRKYFEENRYLSSEFADFGFDWEIHPAYRWALQPSEQDLVYQSLVPTADDS